MDSACSALSTSPEAEVFLLSAGAVETAVSAGSVAEFEEHPASIMVVANGNAQRAKRLVIYCFP
ncbi:hypothetical protein CQ016_06480 [Arthrobacter sp. MYb222]|nr:hypothetical protein CQ016_06480 [Arthrobacter sp. MYb222]